QRAGAGVVRVLTFTTIALPSSDVITATATDPSGNTSEFSACAAIAPPPALVAVKNTNDSGPGSLRQAVADVAPGGTVTFDVAGTITLTGGELTIDKDLTINGPGANQLTVSGNNLSRVFNINGGSVRISGLTISNGH